MRKSLSRAGVLVGVVAIATIALAAPAFAHVEADGDTDADGTTTVTFSFTHGCKGSPTSSLRIQLPADVSDVNAQNPTGWTSNVADGVLTWSGGTVPDTEEGKFVATMVVAGTKGQTVFFPTIQGCVTGEETWIDKSEDPEAEQAAPRIVLTQAVAATGTSTTTKATTGTTAAPPTTNGPTTTKPSAGTAAPTTTAPSSTSSSSSTPLLIGAAVIVLVLIVGGVLIARSRSGSGTSGDSGDSGSAGTGSA